MRKVIVRKPRHIDPFNEPASALSVLNTPLAEWQRERLAPYCQGDDAVDSFDEIEKGGGETLVVGENLWFDEAFIAEFVKEARRKGKAARAAFRQDDAAYLQQGLGKLSRSYEPRGDLVYVDLWYFPEGVTSGSVEPVIISSEGREYGYHHIPSYMGGEKQRLTWVVPERAVCAVDSWVHLFMINVVFGMFGEAVRFERQADKAAFRLRARLSALFEGKPLPASSAYVKVGRNCSIHPSTVFHGPVFIGDNVTIGPGCVISQCMIGDNVTLAHGNQFHMCVIGTDCFMPWGSSGYFTTFMTGASAAQNASIEMSIIGKGSYVGAGTVLTSFDILSTPLQIEMNRHLVEVEMPVLGACIGHNCRIGAGLVVYPGRTIESDVVLFVSPTRRVIMQNISYEESDHHATPGADLHPRQYPREYEQEMVETEW